jgi:hypothetical protein
MFFTATLSRSFISQLLASCFIGIVLFCSNGISADEPKPAAAIQPDDLSKINDQLLTPLRTKCNLELSSSSRSASDQFSFVFETFVVHDHAIEKVFDVIVVRSRNSAAALVRYANGMPCAYIRKGLFVRLDPVTRSLAVYEHSDLNFLLRRENGHSEFILGFTSDGKGAGILFDPLSMIDAGKDIHALTFDSATRTYHATVEHSELSLSLKLSDEHQEYPLKELTVLAPDGTLSKLGSIVVDAPPRMEILNLKKEDFSKSGLPLTMLDKDEFARMKILPESAVFQDEPAIGAALKFWDVFNKPRNALKPNAVPREPKQPAHP